MEIRNLQLQRVHPSPMNPRKTFDQVELEELASNIEKQGLLQPITVRPRKNLSEDGQFDKPDHFEIVCGERRYRAFVHLYDSHRNDNAAKPYDGFREIPAIVREMSDDEAFDAMITENLQRKDVDPIEEAQAIKALMEKGRTSEEIAARLGKPVRFVQDRARLVRLIPELKKKVSEGTMPIVAAQMICKLSKTDQEKFQKDYGNVNVTKGMAEGFTSNLFLQISKSPWYKAGKPNYAGNCGLKCSECSANTANQGCLFADLNDTKDGRCTDRERYFAKCLSFIASEISGCDYDLVKKGEPLEKGKGVLFINDSEWCYEDIRKLREKVKENFSEYEIVSPGVKVSYSHSTVLDDRTKEKLEKGLVYPCLKIFSYDEINPRIEYYGLNDVPEQANEKDPLQELLEKRERIKDASQNREVELLKKIAGEIDPTEMTGELTESEKRALAYIIFANINNELGKTYGADNVYGSQMRKTAKANIGDMNRWLRQFILYEIKNAYGDGLRFEGAREVLPLWSNNYHSKMEKFRKDEEAKLEKNAKELEELGYDTEGNPLDKKRDSRSDLLQRRDELKKKHPDSVILIRVGDFYESFDEDASKISEVLGITETKSKGTSLCGFPHHALDSYLPRLIRSGVRVVIDEPEKK